MASLLTPHQFIAAYTSIPALLTDLTGSYSEWVWTETEQFSFDQLKAALMDAPVLATADLTWCTFFVIED